MTELTIIANAKLNLYLDITGKRCDGYHLIESVMQSVDLSDIVTVKRGGDISVRCSNPLIPENEGNICHKAAKLFFEEIGAADGGAEIFIEKRIPHGAGLGGGSADAAAVLIGLDRLYGGAVSGERLSELGAKVGADVPFCMTGGVKICTGIGERLQETEPFPERAFLVVMPDHRCDTKGAYARYDAALLPKKGGLAEFTSSGAEFPKKMYNVFQELYADERTEKLCGRLIACGAEGASLSGSGAAVFGVFSSADKAMNAAKSFPEFFTAVCKPAPTGTIIVDSYCVPYSGRNNTAVAHLRRVTARTTQKRRIKGALPQALRLSDSCNSRKRLARRFRSEAEKHPRQPARAERAKRVKPGSRIAFQIMGYEPQNGGASNVTHGKSNATATH